LVSVDKVKYFLKIYPEALIYESLRDIEEQPAPHEECILNMITGWIFHLGLTTSKKLSDLLSLPLADIEYAFIQLEIAGVVLRGT
jgi:hypothetical protein